MPPLDSTPDFLSVEYVEELFCKRLGWLFLLKKVDVNTNALLFNIYCHTNKKEMP